MYTQFAQKIVGLRVYCRGNPILPLIELALKAMAIVVALSGIDNGRRMSNVEWILEKEFRNENLQFFSFREKEQEKLEQLEFELEEERGTRKEVEAQLSDFVRYVKKLSKIFSLHLDLERSRNTSD